jgi:hypothetical protein
MVISISEPGTDGGGGGFVEFAELALFASAPRRRPFLLLPNKLPSPFAIASEGLVAALLELLELVGDWLSAVGGLKPIFERRPWSCS